VPLRLQAQGSFARTVHEEWHGFVGVSAARSSPRKLGAGYLGYKQYACTSLLYCSVLYAMLTCPLVTDY
jgi:hypothetical protein